MPTNGAQGCDARRGSTDRARTSVAELFLCAFLSIAGGARDGGRELECSWAAGGDDRSITPLPPDPHCCQRPRLALPRRACLVCALPVH